jgi:hypothetical protein
MEFHFTVNGLAVDARLHTWASNVEQLFTRVLKGRPAIISSSITTPHELGTDIHIMKVGCNGTEQDEKCYIPCPYDVYCALCITEAVRHQYRVVKRPKWIKLYPDKESASRTSDRVEAA